ncbi:hypothetical protein [Breoghania sp.]|uniref:hypothetical protein n=1 Tax=Breoghania sp. TaxID=2065378 RepID=UPI0029CA80B8|nr:hypothetical protein [Breoghania sp.]
MTWLDDTLIVVAVIAFAVLISGPVRRNRNWLATVTPLASIIGSGFLVSVPLLASAIGIWAIPAVIGLTLLAFLIGGAIRYNIRYGEPEFESVEAGHPLKSFETMSHLVLIGAYFISVAYYLVLLAAFGLKLLGWADPLLGKVVATVIISSICLLGATKGLRGVERAEVFTVSANLAAIAALLAGLVIFGTALPQGYSWTAAAMPHHFDWNSLRFLMGLLIIVQGFETTRFMGDLYDGETRIKAMTRAQIVSSIVYVIFFLLMIPLFPFFTSTADVAGFIGVIGRVTPWLPFIVTAGAIASQFSASVADSIGASELVSDTTHKHITPRHAYVVIGAVAVSVIWATDVVSIVSLASRAFALFYALQCIVAVLVARSRGDNGNAVWFTLLAVLTFAIAVLGIPAGA